MCAIRRPGTPSHPGGAVRPQQARFRSPRSILVVTLLLAAGASAVAAAPPSAAATARVTVSGTSGETTTIPGFLIQSSASTSDTGGTISQPGYATSAWFPVPARSTVFAGLLQNNRYPDPFFSTNMRNVSTTDFSVPW